MSSEQKYEENIDNLRKLFYLHNVVSFKIKEIECSAGSSSGDNYMSVVKRVLISSKEADSDSDFDADADADAANINDKEKRLFSIIIKRQISSLSRRLLYRCDEAFSNEINAYTHVVPLLEQYTTDMFVPKCYFAGTDDLGEIIMLEDLKALGFRMHNRLVELDIRYCELVMKHLAQLHAASIAAKQLDNQSFHEKCKHVREIVYCKEAEDFYKNILESSIAESLQSLRASNVDGSLTEPIRLIEKMQKKLYHKIQSCIVNSKESLNVMCHGDLWVNNIMFKMPSDSSELTFSADRTPYAVKFFDLQAMRYTSPVFDILHFIYTSTKRDLRDAHTQQLLEIYCVALSANLEQFFGHATTQLNLLRNTFSLRNITEEYYEHVLYGLAISMWILPAVTFDPKHIPNLDAISELNIGAKDIKCTHMLTPEYHTRLRELALEFYQNGFLDSSLADD